MKKSNDVFSEVIVGVFMVAVLALLVYFTVVISGVDLMMGRSKAITRIAFTDVGGLKERDNVVYRGMKVGVVATALWTTISATVVVVATALWTTITALLTRLITATVVVVATTLWTTITALLTRLIATLFIIVVETRTITTLCTILISATVVVVATIPASCTPC